MSHYEKEVAETDSASAEPDRKHAEREELDGKHGGVAPPTPHICECGTEYRLETDDGVRGGWYCEYEKWHYTTGSLDPPVWRRGRDEEEEEVEGTRWSSEYYSALLG